jgi:hypothetical protein
MRGKMVATSWLTVVSCIVVAASFTEPLTAQKVTTIPSLSAYDDETRRTMELACSTERTNGPVVYGTCLRKQIALL